MSDAAGAATPAAVDSRPGDSAEVRRRLVEALQLDLVGPPAGHAFAGENLPGRWRPSNWYLTGFLIPSGTPPDRSADGDEDDDLDETPAASGLAEESSEERKAAKKGFFPSSMGLSFLAPAEADVLDVTVRWGDYAPATVEQAGGKPVDVWRRRSRERTLQEALSPAGEQAARSRVREVPDSGGLRLQLEERPLQTDLAGLPPGTRSVSVFLVNQRPPDSARPDCAWAFQAEIEVRSRHPFTPRPDPRGGGAGDRDARVADLHYADTPEYAAGHGVSADWDLVGGACRVLRTAWIPHADVEKTESEQPSGAGPSAERSMEALGALPDGPAAEAALRPLVAHYRSWIEAQRGRTAALSGARSETAAELRHEAGRAADRIERGIAALARDADALDAFRTANRAVARALRRRLGDAPGATPPRWRAFQLAFVLLNVAGLADPRDADRDVVDLLFFPTGGGKTEAYLGLAAFAMVLRRLRHPGQDGRLGAGVSVIMRYTLRLLTLDQFGRAASLVCALELEREADPARYGAWPFEIGLWVGKAATPNVLGRKGASRPDSARARTRQFKANPAGRRPPIPLEDCPWCGARFEADSFTLWPDDDRPTELRVVCMNFDCDFSGDRPLPLLAVDDPIYRRLPAFLIATVDKFAALPWEARTGVLLGGADRCDDAGFHGPAEPRRGRRLDRPLPPPDLVIQDELHLISGPLGTLAGLYESVIDALCTRDSEGRAVRPKIVASTATVRQAGEQIQALFGRADTRIFPPPGPDRRDSCFARTVPLTRVAGRHYLGVAAPGRNPKVIMRRVWLALMGAAERACRDAGGRGNPANPADPYMTVLGYFNSLRELGGARRILEEEVRSTVRRYGERRRVGEVRGLFQNRQTFSEVLELTSRVSTGQVAEARRRLELPFHEKDRVDCAIATNMISVGLDIARLGLMVVLGQPKTHAECRLLAWFEERIARLPFADRAEREQRRRDVRRRVADLLDAWRAVAGDYRAHQVALKYQRHEDPTGRPLLREMLDTDFESERHRQFRAVRSLRDVEPEVNLYLRTLGGEDVAP